MVGRRFVVAVTATPLVAALCLVTAGVLRSDWNWADDFLAVLPRMLVLTFLAEFLFALPVLFVSRYFGKPLFLTSIASGCAAALLMWLAVSLFRWEFSFWSLFLALLVGTISAIGFWIIAFWKSGFEYRQVNRSV
jgi:hypothetical protein